MRILLLCFNSRGLLVARIRRSLMHRIFFRRNDALLALTWRNTCYFILPTSSIILIIYCWYPILLRNSRNRSISLCRGISIELQTDPWYIPNNYRIHVVKSFSRKYSNNSSLISLFTCAIIPTGLSTMRRLLVASIGRAIDDTVELN